MKLKEFSLQNKDIESYNITKMYNDKVLLLENNSNSIIMNISDLDAFIKSTKDTYAVANYYGIDKLYDRDDIEYIHTNNMIKLYHVTVDYNNEPDYKIFQPRIPKSAPKMEGICFTDFTQQHYQRVCFSDSIEGCINAIKDGIYYIRDDNIIKVYEIEVPMDEKLKFPNDLYENYNVDDADFTHEHWYMGNLFLKGRLYEVTDWLEDFYYAVDDYERDIFIRNILESNNVDAKYISIVKEYDFCNVLNYYLTDYFKDRDFQINIGERFPDIYKYLEMYRDEYDIGFKEYIFNSKVKAL